MNKKWIIAGLSASVFLIPATTEAAGSYYYWHHGDMDDTTVLNSNFRQAIKYNHFTYDDVNINTSFNTFKNVMRQNGYSYKKVRTNVYQSRNATFVFKGGRLNGLYFSFKDYAISSGTIKKHYGTPASINNIKNGKTYVYNGQKDIKNKFDFVKTSKGYKLTGFMTSK